MQNKKRILNVRIKRMVDESPDTSWLGEYANHSTSEYSIDRKHSLECIANTPQIIPVHTLYECGICSSLHRWEFDGDCREDSERFGDSSDYAKLYSIPDQNVSVLSWEDRENADNGCTCDESGDMEWNEYRYFNPSFNYVDKTGHALPENTPEEVRKYVRQDYERMEDLNKGNWCFMGVRADCEVQLTPFGTIQHITSGGLWGIESDSEESYIESVEKDELADLRTQLRALGFSTRAISTAFKTIERRGE